VLTDFDSDKQLRRLVIAVRWSW